MKDFQTILNFAQRSLMKSQKLLQRFGPVGLGFSSSNPMSRIFRTNHGHIRSDPYSSVFVLRCIGPDAFLATNHSTGIVIYFLPRV